MKDFSFWNEYEGTSEGSGRSEKVWLQNSETGQIGLFKFKKDVGTTDHISECIAYHLAMELEIPCAKFELGTYRGREGSMSYNIIQNPNEILIEGIYFIYYMYPTYNDETFIDEKTGHKYSIEMIVKCIESFVSIDMLLNMLLFDFLIGNTDRHQSNWAMISSDSKMDWSPLYDNSSSLCAYISNDQANSYLGKDKKRWQSLIDTKSKSLIRCKLNDDKRPTHLTVLRYTKDLYFDKTSEMVKKISTVLTEEKICDILNKYAENELCSEKKELIKRFLLSKIQMMKEVYFGEEK